ncbi:MAG: linear amide C-N hydrolase [Bacilli bacterium]|nr:linear amide C-N hydrolase [Bacilli bacterium]
MKKSRPFLLMLTVPMLLAGLTSCAKKGVEHGEFVKDIDVDPNGLDYLYDVTYNNYNWDDVTDWMNGSHHHSLNQAGFGCSSIHLGNFYGRSFDFCVTDMCEFLVRTNRENGHYASIGISIADCKTNEELVKAKKFDDKMIPFAMVDGINENGVVCNTNVVPAKDLEPHEEDTDRHYHTRGTNPGKKDLFYQFIPRFILDNAKSAQHAVDLLKERNITAVNSKGEVCDMFGVDNMGYELHCMIADRNDTFVIEFTNDKLSIMQTPIMTNFYLSRLTDSGAGLERYEVLAKRTPVPGKVDPIEKIETIEDMKKLIQFVQYSPCYDPEWNGKDTDCAMWPTEFAGCEVIKEGAEEKLTFYNAEKWCRSNWVEIEGLEPKEGLKDQLAGVTKQIQDALKIPSGTEGREQKPGGKVPWISTHAEAYDIDNLTLHLVTQEKTIEGGEKDGQYDFKEYKLFEEE